MLEGCLRAAWAGLRAKEFERLRHHLLLDGTDLQASVPLASFSALPSAALNRPVQVVHGGKGGGSKSRESWACPTCQTGQGRTETPSCGRGCLQGDPVTQRIPGTVAA